MLRVWQCLCSFVISRIDFPVAWRRPPHWPSGKASASEVADLFSIPASTTDLFLDRLIQINLELLLQWLLFQVTSPDWHTAMHSLRLQRLLWIYCPGHAGVSGNELADRLASTADITSGLQLGRAEVLRGLRNFLSTDKPEHHSIDRLKERGVEKGSGRHSTLKGRQRSVFNQANIGTVSRAALGRLLRDGEERVWAFPSATMPS